MSDKHPELAKLKSNIRSHMFTCLVVVLALLVGIGGWMTMTSISGAVVAPGSIEVETGTKLVQHEEGGIVTKILVQDGDYVKAGQILAQLDGTVVKANLAIINQQLAEQYGAIARLEAQRSNTASPDFSGLEEVAIPQSKKASIIKNEGQLFTASVSSFKSQIGQIKEQINQFYTQIDGFKAEYSSAQKQIDIIGIELKDLQSLLQKGLVKKSQVLSLQRKESELEGSSGDLTARIAKAKQAISERKVQEMQLKEDYSSRVLEKLQEATSKAHQLHEQKITAQDQLVRLDIRAPRAGYVQSLETNTVGGVISHGDVLMKIVPKEDRLIAEVHVAPNDISRIYVGEKARIRIPSFDQKTTPELYAKIINISADTTVNERTGQEYYTAKLSISHEEQLKLKGKRLVPGMPVDAFIQTSDRTVLSYLIKPLQDQASYALRER
ncbi:HlyD family type I secretion periplasmic adaptor subunit [Flexibacterium corallicola]|uniref:HlyD family type I secretion periplasmic adaptor subunit n=1 Tax=Flexibacterium corallicola TaxID=3037259 RepID=UPI00286F5C31|nr:HlyD family type I secretion periplasmic adaptor subunit [Pseudovibrio sp. M1P-2-3]